MQVLILVIVVLVLGVFAVSVPKVGQTFPAWKQKAIKFSRWALVFIVAGSVCFMVYNMIFGNNCGEYDVDTDVYAIELKTDGDRMLEFLGEMTPVTLFGDEAKELMDDLFSDTTDGSLLEWNTIPSWAGKYNARVFYTERDYQLHINNKSPDKIVRNSFTEGVIVQFTLCENGSAYSNVYLPNRPIYKVRMSNHNYLRFFPLK